MLEIDDVVAEPLGDRDDDLRRLRPLLGLLRHEVVIALDARLALRLAGLGRGLDPVALALERALARLFLAALLLQALLLLPEPGGVVALVGNAAAAIELEDPARDVVEEIAVVRDEQHGARIGAQMPFEPGRGLRVEMVRRLVEEQQLGLLQEQPAERDATPLTAGERRHLGIVRRAGQRLHRLVDLGIEVPEVLGVDLVLQARHLLGRLVRVVHGDLVVAIDQRLLRRDAEHDVAAHVERLVEMRLLRQVSGARALGEPGFARPFLVLARHDAHERRFAGAVDAENADLGIGVEGEIDVLQHLLAAGIGLGEAAHVINELPRHGACRSLVSM